MIRKFIKKKQIAHSSKEVDGIIAKINLSDAAKDKLFRGMIITGSAYVLASIASLLSLSLMTDSVTSNTKKLGISTQVHLNKQPKINYVNNRKTVLGRNLFNSEGSFPDEQDEVDEEQTVDPGTPFNMNAPCSDPSVNLKLIGTIAMEPPENSLATLKDPSYSEVDVYRIGDELIEQDGIIVVGIDRKQIILNNKGRKECIKIEEKEIKQNDGFGDFGDVTASVGKVSEPEPEPPANSGSEVVVLDPTYVAEQLGEGYIKIMNAGRVVPALENTAGDLKGFKIFAIKGGSILSRIGLKNGDIITQVNKTSLKQAEQGHALYKALEEEREIEIRVERGGQPTALKVQIK